MGVSSSYCYSDTSYGVTQNAANNALSWSMGTYLPDASNGYTTVDIHGLTYRYTMMKDPETGSTVWVRNEDAINGGYIFEHKDDWGVGNDGGTIQKYFRFPYVSSNQFGDGSIAVEGEGQIVDPSVTYNYRVKIDEQLQQCYATPLADPACPGFQQALLDLLANMPSPEVGDPFYDEWVQANMSLNDESDEAEQQEQLKEPPEDLENQLGGKNSIDAMVNTVEQDAILAELAKLPTIEPYYIIAIPGGIYEDKFVLEDAKIPDNNRALRNLASDATHKTMIRSQYDRD